ncbi:hypothetical protein F5I97DRAFT_1907989 [Phlebopus sp. FC_14]|nr:hypothetical protein F5I97DRAFT_1907989 [Phlebopus sp. FC_14]
MPSFLNKVFGRKRQDEKDASQSPNEASDNVLLDGKYEAISPVLSPSIIAFAEALANKDKERDHGFSLFRPKSRVGSSKTNQKRADAVPQLSLQLPGPKENSDSRALGVVFEADPDSQTILDDEVIGARRLNPLEALILVRVCSQAITERGLETLGIMHPHWFSASPDFQRKLISLFIHSLAPKSPITTLSPTPTSATSTFETEVGYARSPHDVAAVLRWGLRHLKLENGHFGKDISADEWAWYKTFFDAERASSYPPKGFTDLLLPQLPTAHIELLLATLDVISALAAHAEANSISGSKLSKFLGLWLLTATRSEETDDWAKFYVRWERAGRILEHLFLSRLREDSLSQRLPTRLQELTEHYPYNRGSPVVGEDLLPPPRFSTRKCDALLLRVESQPKQHPIRLILEAFQLQTDSKPGNEHLELWNAIKTASMEASSRTSSSSTFKGPQLTRLLSMIPADSNDPSSPTLLTSPITKILGRRRAPTSDASAAASPTTSSSLFSTSGFGDVPIAQPLASTLLDQEDTEVTHPPMSRKSSRKRNTSRRRGRSSSNGPASAAPTTPERLTAETVIIETKLASVDTVQIDEAFIDFWSDAIVDPISAGWPTFVICGLKPIPGAEKPVQWLVIEQSYVRQQPALSLRATSPDGPRGRTSPRPSFRSEISAFRLSSTFASTRKRFSIFSKSSENVAKKSTGKSPKVSELGEILAEEEEKLDEKKAPVTSSSVPSNGVDGQALEVATTPATNVTAVMGVQPDSIHVEPTEAIPASTLPSLPAEPITAVAGDVPTKQTISPVSVGIPNAEPSIGQVKDLSEEAPSAPIQISAQPAPGNVDSFLLPDSDGADQASPVADKEEGQSGHDNTDREGQIDINVIPEPESVDGDADSLPPAPETVALAGETPGPQTALHTSEPAALAQIADDAPVAATPEVAVAADDEGHALTVTNSVVDVPVGEGSQDVAVEPAPAASLPEVPVVNASPELPVTPPEQVPLVQERVAESSTVSEPVTKGQVVPDTSSAVDVAVAEPSEEPVEEGSVKEPTAADVSDPVSVEPLEEPVKESPVDEPAASDVSQPVSEPVSVASSEEAVAKSPVEEPFATDVPEAVTEPHATEVPTEQTVIVDEASAEQIAAESKASAIVEASHSAEEPSTSGRVSGPVVDTAEEPLVDEATVGGPPDVPAAEPQLGMGSTASSEMVKTSGPFLFTCVCCLTDPNPFILGESGDVETAVDVVTEASS